MTWFLKSVCWWTQLISFDLSSYNLGLYATEDFAELMDTSNNNEIIEK